MKSKLSVFRGRFLFGYPNHVDGEIFNVAIRRYIQDPKKVEARLTKYHGALEHIGRGADMRQKALMVAMLFLVMLLSGMAGRCAVADAADKTCYPKAERYEDLGAARGSFVIDQAHLKQDFIFGADSLGRFNVSGNIESESMLQGLPAYSVSGDLQFRYLYSQRFQKGDEDEWGLIDSEKKEVAGVKLPKKMGKGIIIPLRSTDCSNWEPMGNPIYDCFRGTDTTLDPFCTVAADEVKQGTYYMVVVAYEMRRRVGISKMLNLIPADSFEYAACMEVYRFYIGYGIDPIHLYQTNDRSDITGQSRTEEGFVVDSNGADVNISVQKDGGAPIRVNNYASFYAPGKYKITAVSPIGDIFEKEMQVLKGMTVQTIVPMCHESEASEGYQIEAEASGTTALSSMILAQEAGGEIKRSVLGDQSAYGINRKNVRVFLRLLDQETYNKKGWEIQRDDWGKKGETIGEVSVGEVASGAVIVMKSRDGSAWEWVDAGRYAKGLYTTDFYEHYGLQGDTLVYTPEGSDLLHGVYIKVLYAFKKKEVNGKQVKRCVEEYSFYLCNDNLEAITFHNLSVQEKLEEMCGTDDDVSQEIYKSAESMDSGTVTFSGFEIDMDLNPAASYEVRRNGIPAVIPANGRFEDTGRYDIKLKSKIGTERSVTLFVDRMSAEESLKLYFGDGFLRGKRIYSEGDYPIYDLPAKSLSRSLLNVI